MKHVCQHGTAHFSSVYVELCPRRAEWYDLKKRAARLGSVKQFSLSVVSCRASHVIAQLM